MRQSQFAQSQTVKIAHEDEAGLPILDLCRTMAEEPMPGHSTERSHDALGKLTPIEFSQRYNQTTEKVTLSTVRNMRGLAERLPMEHKTPLMFHFKQKHIWLDIGLLAVLFVVASYIPLLKIVPLVASLELFSFFSFHLLAKRNSLKLQGFLGGFISSTAVFLQILNDEKFASLPSRDLITTLLFSLCAMLLECVFILFVFSTQLPFIYYLPFFLQLGFFIAVIFLAQGYLRSKDTASQSPEMDIELLIDHPIIWKNVVKLSLVIILMVSVMNVIGEKLGFSREISTLLISFFEAHAVLAATIFQWSLDQKNVELLQLIFLILLGNTLSKSYLVYKSHNLARKWTFIVLIFAGFIISVVFTSAYVYLGAPVWI